MVETRLGLLSRCKGGTWSVIPLPKQGWVCYPTAGSSILLVSERLRLGGVGYPRRCYVEENFTKLWACIAEVFECSRKRGPIAQRPTYMIVVFHSWIFDL